MTVVTRFAPSPTGHLHLGHAHAALLGWRAAKDVGGRFLLRIEDIDRARCRAEFTQAIEEDLAWLGVAWDGGVRKQSAHMDDYRAALDQLEAMGLLYPCFCTRAAIKTEIEAASAAPHGAGGPVYSGTCRAMAAAERRERLKRGEAHALRLDMGRAARAAQGQLFWEDARKGAVEAAPTLHGDVVLARKDVPASYHLSVTVDDALQGVTLVTRGEDLFAATDIHRLLQALLGLPTPRYWHHALLAGPDGGRLAKRDRAITLKGLRAIGKTPDEVRAMAGFPS
jgi:glutamyl-Q tRNA(Asp) synthetase